MARSFFAGAVIPLALLWVSFCAVTQCTAADVTLVWEPSPEERVVSYRVYYGRTSGQYESFVETDEGFAARIKGLEPGMTYFFAATALNEEGLESGYSNEVEWQAPGEPSDMQVPGIQVQSVTPTVVNLTCAGEPGATYEIEYSEDLQTWASLAILVMPENGWTRIEHQNPPAVSCFYRRVLLSSEMAELESQ